MKIFLEILITAFFSFLLQLSISKQHNMTKLKEEAAEMFDFAYNSYMKYAYPYDELRPFTCDGHDTWGGFSLSLIDTMDTLVVLGRTDEFKRAVELVLKNTELDKDKNVSVFEINIRIVGGLLSAHMLAKKGGLDVDPGWPCNGPLLRLSESVARRLLPAFNTVTGMPYGTVNLRHGVPPNETPITCTAGVTTFIVEFGALSRLTGDPIFEDKAMKALRAMWIHRSEIGLVGNHINVQTGKWTAIESGIGPGIDSYFEYLVKGSALFRNPELRYMFDEYLRKIQKYIEHDDWHFWVKMNVGSITQTNFQSLEAFWPGLLTMIGDIDKALRTLHNYHQVWKLYGFTPEYFNVAQTEPVKSRSNYPLRPELIESIMYVYRATKDPTVLQMGVDILRSIQTVTRTKCGFATIYDVTTHQMENRMESFFLSETLKYLYLLFDEDNFIHSGTSPDQFNRHSETIPTLAGGQCIIGSGGYIFNTEAHPIDPGVLYCCHGNGYHEDLIQLHQMHQHYPLLRLLNVTDAELALANTPDESNEELAAMETVLEEKSTLKYITPLYKTNERNSRVNESINNQQALLGCLNVKFHYRFLLYGQVFDIDNNSKDVL